MALNKLFTNDETFDKKRPDKEVRSLSGKKLSGSTEDSDVLSRDSEGKLTLTSDSDKMAAAKNQALPEGGLDIKEQPEKTEPAKPVKKLNSFDETLNGKADNLASTVSEAADNTKTVVEDKAGDLKEATPDFAENVNEHVSKKEKLAKKVGELCPHADVDALVEAVAGLVDKIPGLQGLLDDAINLENDAPVKGLVDCYKRMKNTADTVGGDFSLDLGNSLKEQALKGNADLAGSLGAMAKVNGDPVDETDIGASLMENIDGSDEEAKEDAKDRTKTALSNKNLRELHKYRLTFDSDADTAVAKRYYTNEVSVDNLSASTDLTYLYTDGDTNLTEGSPSVKRGMVLEPGTGIPENTLVHDVVYDSSAGESRIYLSNKISWEMSGATIVFRTPAEETTDPEKIHEGMIIQPNDEVNWDSQGIPKDTEVVSVRYKNGKAVLGLSQKTTAASSSSDQPYVVDLEPSTNLDVDGADMVEKTEPQTGESIPDVNAIDRAQRKSNILEDDDVYKPGADESSQQKQDKVRIAGTVATAMA